MDHEPIGLGAFRADFRGAPGSPRARLSYHLPAMSAALFLLLDPLCLLAAAWLASPRPAAELLWPAVLAAAALSLFVLYDPRFGRQASRGGLAAVLRAHGLRFGVFAALLLGLGAAGGRLQDLQTAWLLSWLAAALALTSLARVLLAVELQRLQRAGRLAEVIAVVGAGQAAQRLVHALRRDGGQGVELLGVFDDGFEGALPAEARPRGTVQDLIALGQTRKIDWIVLALPAQAEHRLPQVLTRLKTLSVPIGLCPRHLEADLMRPGVAYVGGHVPVGLLVQPPVRRGEAVLQAGEALLPRWIVTVLLLALTALGALGALVAPLRRARPAARTPSADRESARRVNIDAYDLAAFTHQAAHFGQQRYGYVVTPNADHLIRLHDEPSFRVLYDEAAFVLLDSRFVARLLRLTRGVDLPVCPGSDLTAALLRKVAVPDDRIVLIGGSAAQAQALRQRHGLRGLVQFIPPMGFVHDPAAFEACLRFVESHSPFRFCLLAVGSPQQEMLAQALRRRGRARGLALCIGASINFLTGDERRAPAWMQRHGMEWLYRLVQDPRRLAHRYLVRGPRVFGVLRASEVVLRPAASARERRAGTRTVQRPDQRGISRP